MKVMFHRSATTHVAPHKARTPANQHTFSINAAFMRFTYNFYLSTWLNGRPLTGNPSFNPSSHPFFSNLKTQLLHNHNPSTLKVHTLSSSNHNASPLPIRGLPPYQVLPAPAHPAGPAGHHQDTTMVQGHPVLCPQLPQGPYGVLPLQPWRSSHSAAHLWRVH